MYASTEKIESRTFVFLLPTHTAISVPIIKAIIAAVTVNRMVAPALSKNQTIYTRAVNE